MGILPGSGGDVDKSAHFLNSANDNGNQSLSKLSDLDQDTVNQTYQADLGGGGSVFSNAAGPLGQVFGGIAGLPDAFGQLVSKLFGLAGPFNSVASAINTIEHDIIGTIQGGVATLQGIVSGVQTDLTNAVSTLNSLIFNVVSGFIAAVSGIPFVGGTIAAALSQLFGTVKNQQAAAQNFTISTLATSPRNPAHICRYPVGDVTFSEELLGSFSVFGVTQAASAGTAHTHDIDGNFVVASSNTWRIQQNNARGGYITVSNTCVYDTVAVGALKATTAALNNIFVEVFRENSDGSLSELFSQEISASITTALTYTELPLPNVIIAQAGERYMVRVRNSTTVDTLFSVAGMTQETMAVDSSIFFSNSTDATKTSYTAAQATAFRAGSNILPWCLLAAKNAVQPELSWNDDFNRQFLGPEWITTGLTIVNSQLAYGGTTDGQQTAFYIRRTTRDAQKVSGNVFINAGVTTQRAALQLHADREGTQSVEISPTATDCRIISYANGVATQRASVAVGGTDFYELYYDVPTDSYIGLKNGATFGLQWLGAGSAAKHGDRYRFYGARIACVGGIPAATIDNTNLTDFAGL